MHEFFEKYPDAGAGTTPRLQAVEKVENNIAWLQKNERKIVNWLEQYGGA